MDLGPSSYGDSFADVYDQWYSDIGDAGATAAFVIDRAGPGPILELGVGTGRIAKELLAHGASVIGVDASAAMLSRCDRGPNQQLIRGDLAHLPIRTDQELAPLGAALCAFNTLFNLPSSDEQAQLFGSLAQALEPDGAFVVEAITGAALAHGDGDSIGVSRITSDRLVLAATKVDSDAQTILGQHVDITDKGIRLRPWQLRWSTPEQIDEMAESAGLALVERYGDWDCEPFTDSSDKHVSVYRPKSVG